MEQRNGFWDAVDGRLWSGGPQRSEAPGPWDAYEQALGVADQLVTRLLGEMNQVLLGSRGAVSSRRSDWSPAMHVWQLWDDPRQEQGAYLYLTLLLTSRGRPYLKVGRQAIPLDARTEQRLLLALRRAFAQPHIRAPRPLDQPGRGSRARYEAPGRVVPITIRSAAPAETPQPTQSHADQRVGAHAERSNGSRENTPAGTAGRDNAGASA